MKYQKHKYLILSFSLAFGIILGACASQTPTSTTTQPDTSNTATQTEVNQETDILTPTDQPSTPRLPTATKTATDMPEPTKTVPAVTETATFTPKLTAIACSGVLTPSQQEGPFFSPGSPQRSSLIDAGMPGVPVLIFGRVFDQDCNPIPGAKIDFWLADVNGEYDNVGYTLRGHVFSDQDGFYILESIEPTSYTGRPPHIHVKVYSPSGEELLTTQMYFAGSEASAEVSNNPELYVNYLESDEDGGLQVLFNIVVNY